MTATGSLGFGVLLARLSERRHLDAASLAQRAGVAESELLRVLAGAVPSPALLRRLAPALRLHTADLFVIAGAALPEDLAAVDVKARGLLPGLVKVAVLLPPAGRAELRRLVRSLPRRQLGPDVPAVPAAPAVRAVPPAPSLSVSLAPPPQPGPPGPLERLGRPDPGSPAAVLIRLAGCRNLERIGMAKVFYLLTGRYWSASTYAMVGSGRKELTPDLVADFGTVLGIPAADLGVLTGVTPPGESLERERTPGAAADVAGLLWDLRSLTAEQVRHVDKVARALPSR
jgi:transcriptional regulator with XRE-family HTH domain